MQINEGLLEAQFHEAMLGLYEAGKKLKPPYVSPRFLRMVQEHGGREAASRLLATGDPSEGFTELFLRGKDKLKYSVEYFVLMESWKALFTEEELAVAKKRLQDVNCELPPGA